MKKHLLLFITFAAAAIAANAQWQQGNGLNGGTVNCLAVKDTILFAGTDTGGVYISYDNGLNWAPSNNGLLNKNIVAIVVKGNLVVAGAANGLGNGCIFLSTDNGANWTTPTNQYYGFLFTLYVYGVDILAGTWYGVARSTNNGDSWTTLSTTGLPSNASVSSITAANNNIFAGVSSSGGGGSGVFLSTNNGNSWNTKNNGLTNPIINTLEQFNGKVFAGTSTGGVFASSDNGNNWSPAGSGITNQNIKTLYTEGAHLYAGTADGIFITSDGANWKHINANLPVNAAVSSVIARGNYIFIGSGETVWRRPIAEVNTGVGEMPSKEISTEVYPNPTQGKLTVKVQQPARDLKISVINPLGEVIYFSHTFEGNEASIDLSSQKPGIYLLQVQNGNDNVLTQKVIIQ